METGVLSNKLDFIWQMVLEYSPKLILAILVFVIGFWVVNKITAVIARLLEKSFIDETVQPFIKSLVNISLKALVVFSIAEIVGIETTSFVAVMAAAGFAVGLALQGSLSNFAAGVLVLVFKPYKVEDLVKIQDQIGYVEEIQIINTVLNNFDNERIIIPNSIAINDIVKNYSTDGTARLELEAFISYNQSMSNAREAILSELNNCELLLQEPKPICEISTFDTHNVQLTIKPYCLPEHYEEAGYQANEAIQRALAKGAIEIAYVEGVQRERIGQ